MEQEPLDRRHMARALQLAARGRGYVEPNPLVGCVITRGEEIVAEGWHQSYGEPHAEVVALKNATGPIHGGSMYVTLEPCCHKGKTPPCTQAILSAGLGRVVVAMVDPFPAVSGKGIAELAEAGLSVEVGTLAERAAKLNAPYIKLIMQRRPWVIAKWAMTLDGKLATRTGDSRWVSNEASRSVVHQLRGRVDAIVVGRHTAEMDDPLLTARPEGARIATRIVLDSNALLSQESQLVRTARDVPVLVAVGPTANQARQAALRHHGCEVLQLSGVSHKDRLEQLLDQLGGRRMTNVLFEGGGEVLGSLFDAAAIDEVHAFVVAKAVGGTDSTTPIGGRGLATMASAAQLVDFTVERLDDDVYIHGELRK